MATDVDVQFFSHLNGLALGNNWGDLVRLLDAALVNGVNLPSITSASIDAQGDVHLTLYANHNALLLQVVELTGFEPVSLNQKYRIKGIPESNKLILKPKLDIVDRIIGLKGSVKLASLGYEVIYRDVNDVKRVYRAKDPTPQHPFIRIDESIASDAGSYNSAYAKYAMVGLLEHMDHIDDYLNPNVLQLPFNTADPEKNWKIKGVGTGVVRGWARWYFRSTRMVSGNASTDINMPSNTGGTFCLFGGSDAFYISMNCNTNDRDRQLYGCGLYRSALKTDVIPNWFLGANILDVNASFAFTWADFMGATMIGATWGNSAYKFITTAFNELSPLQDHAIATPIVPDFQSGRSNLYPSSQTPALEIPFYANAALRGSLKHVFYAGKTITEQEIIISETSMYLALPLGYRSIDATYGGFYVYLGEIE